MQTSKLFCLCMLSIASNALAIGSAHQPLKVLERRADRPGQLAPHYLELNPPNFEDHVEEIFDVHNLDFYDVPKCKNPLGNVDEDGFTLTARGIWNPSPGADNVIDLSILPRGESLSMIYWAIPMGASSGIYATTPRIRRHNARTRTFADPAAIALGENNHMFPAKLAHFQLEERNTPVLDFVRISGTRIRAGFNIIFQVWRAPDAAFGVSDTSSPVRPDSRPDSPGALLYTDPVHGPESKVLS